MPDHQPARSERFAGTFRDLYDASAPRVLAFAARRTPTLADAEDATAATFSVAWQRFEDAPSNPLAWLYAICRRVIANQRRGSRRVTALRERLFGGRSAPTGMRMDGGPATEALARLREQDRELIRLVAWEDLDHAAIAVVLGISVNAVAIRLHRARARFADELRSVPRDGVKGFPSIRTSGVVTGTSKRNGSEETQ